MKIVEMGQEREYLSQRQLFLMMRQSEFAYFWHTVCRCEYSRGLIQNRDSSVASGRNGGLFEVVSSEMVESTGK